MAMKWWYSNTETEYIFDYTENIADPKDTSTTEVKIVVTGTKRVLTVTNAKGEVTTANIKPPKKPTDTGGNEINSFIEFIMSDKLEEFKKRYLELKNEVLK